MPEDPSHYCSYKSENKFKKGKDIIYLPKRARDHKAHLSNKAIYLSHQLLGIQTKNLLQLSSEHFVFKDLSNVLHIFLS